MDKIKIVGGTPLKGQVSISGAKNAALPLLAAGILTDQALTLKNLPDLADIRLMIQLLESLGVSATLFDEKLSSEKNAQKSTFLKKGISLKGAKITSTEATYDLVRKMRASILVLGPLVARCGEAKVSLPGGCAIGNRPVDLHIKGLEKMGAHIDLERGYIHATAPNGLKGADITFPIVSVTGTENLMMAATLAQGTTRLINAAQEPEITDLAECLNKMGARITGIGTSTLEIEGVSSLHGAEHTILSDRIEAGTYAVAAAITGGCLDILGTNLNLLPTFKDCLEQTGATITALPVEGTCTTNVSPEMCGFRVEAPAGRPKPVDLSTAPFPGYPTDLQAQMMALLSLADGQSVIKENIFENRFMHVSELNRMGAAITADGSIATVKGSASLTGAEVMATDLRASFSLVLAALAAQGETTINRVYHLDRGYERAEEKLRACGANITRLKEENTATSTPKVRVA